MRTILFLTLSLIVCFAPRGSAAVPVRQVMLATPEGGRVEYFWSKPEGGGPFPVLLLVHPEQDSPKLGGAAFVKMGQLDYWTERGYVTAAVSQPGYGASDGPADFCGPRTQGAVRAVIQDLRRNRDVDPEKIFLYGGSRGAVVAARVAAAEPSLAGVVLKSGVYDLLQWSASRPWYDPIKLTMVWEIGWPTIEKLRERSAFHVAEKIRVPLLLIHGTADSRAPISLAQSFAARVRERGGKARLVPVDSEHVIPMDQISGLIESFLREQR